MNIYIANFIGLKSIYIDNNQNYDQSYPIPQKLMIILKNCGYLLGKDLYGWISPEYEKTILDNLGNYLNNRFGISRIWKSVYSSPDLVPTYDQSKLDQHLLYENPGYIDTIRERSSSEEASQWELNTYNSSTILHKSGENEIKKYISDLLSSQVPPGSIEKSIISWGISEISDLNYPDKIPCKELLCMVLSEGKGINSISGVNDILRTATYLGSDDVTLSNISGRFKLSRKNRRKIINLLDTYLTEDSIKYRAQDTKKYYGSWVILSQILHVKSGITKKFFDIVFGKDRSWKHEGFESKLQQEYDRAGKTGSLVKVINLLSKRPGELIRRYDSILRRCWNNKDTLGLDTLMEAFSTIQNIRPKILLELYQSYGKRNMMIERSFKDKRGIRHYYSPLDPLDDEIINISKSIIMSGLRKIWGESKEYEGKKVYIPVSRGEQDLIISERTSGEDTIKSGVKVHFEPKGTLKFFCQWIDPDGSEDLDLHSWLITEDGNVDRLSWNTSFSVPGIKHSGDVRHVKGDCQEYVSINFSKKIPYTWMLVGVQNFESQSLDCIENYMGFGNGEKTIYRSQVTVKSKNMFGFIVNLKKGYIKTILEGTEWDLLKFKSDVIKQYTVPGIDLRTIVEEFIKSKGGEVVKEITEETMSLEGDLSNLIINS